MHGLTAQIALVLALVLAGSATVLALSRRATGSFFIAGALWTAFVVGLAGVFGIAVAITERAPQDPLHIVYGVLAVGVIPGAAIVASGRPGPRQAAVWAIAGVVLLIIVLRLFQTGG